MSTTLWRDSVKSTEPFEDAEYVEPVIADAPFTTRFEWITPDRAKYLLSQRLDIATLQGGGEGLVVHGNRNVNYARVQRYLTEMEGDFWEPTHQGIALDQEGRLIDGQHRLWAIIISGTTQKMMVSEGVSRDTFYLLDQGFSRNASSFLTGKYAGARAALVRSLIRLIELDGHLALSTIVGPQYPAHTLLGFLDANPSVQSYGEAYAALAEKCGRKFPGTSAGGLLFAGYLVGEDNWGQWWEDVENAAWHKAPEDTKHPVTALVNSQPTSGNMTARNHLRAAIAADLFRRGARVPGTA